MNTVNMRKAECNQWFQKTASYSDKIIHSRLLVLYMKRHKCAASSNHRLDVVDHLKWINQWARTVCTTSEKGGVAISHLVSSSPLTSSCTLDRERATAFHLEVRVKGQQQPIWLNTRTLIIPEAALAHSFPQSTVLLTQCLTKANRFLATEQSWDAPGTATTPAMAKTAIGKTNLPSFCSPVNVSLMQDAERCLRAQKTLVQEKQKSVGWKKKRF